MRVPRSVGLVWPMVLIAACGDSSSDPGSSSGGGGEARRDAPHDASTGADAPSSGSGDAAMSRPDRGGDMGTGTDGEMMSTLDSGVDPTGSGNADTGITCQAREVSGDAQMHFHHVHFNTTDPAADVAFFDAFLGAPPVDFCQDEEGGTTQATRTARGYFLYTRVDEAPDPTLNTYLEHVGWIHPSPTEELHRLVELGVTLYPEDRAQCAEAFAGEMACGSGGYYFYLLAPSGARIEVARGPGPAMSGFGHVHMVQGVDWAFFETVTDGAYQSGAIDMVNHTDVALTEDRLDPEMVVETRGKPIDHIAYSTTDLAAAKARIEAAGIAIEEDIAFRPAFGFESFFVKSPKGIWVEIVADSPFAP